MKRLTTVLFAALLLCFTPVLTADEALTKVSLDDPADDVTGPEEGPPPADILKVDLTSDGKTVIVAVTLASTLKPVSIFDALVAGVAFDIDDDPATGGHGFGGMYGNAPGFEFESEIVSSVEEGAESKSASASVIAIDAESNQSNVLYASDAPSTSAKGKTYTGKIAYEALGVKPGEIVRILVRELSDRGEHAGMFPAVRLKLK